MWRGEIECDIPSTEPAAEDVSNKHFSCVVLTNSLSAAQRPTPQNSTKQETLRQPQAAKQEDREYQGTAAAGCALRLKTKGCACTDVM